MDENLKWQSHIALILNKVSKNTGLLFKASFILSKDACRSFTFPKFISTLNVQILYGPPLVKQNLENTDQAETCKSNHI